MSQITLQKYDCDRCGETYKKDSLRRQRGMLLCGDCRDNLKKIPAPNPRWASPRDNSDSTTAVNTPTVYTISAATGITALGQSSDYDREGGRRHFYMQVVSDGGAISITANPQIVNGIQNDVLTLTGTSDTDTIKLTDHGYLNLILKRPFTLTDGDSITFVYNTITTVPTGWGTSPWGSFGWGAVNSPTEGWTECSRNKGGF